MFRFSKTKLQIKTFFGDRHFSFSIFSYYHETRRLVLLRYLDREWSFFGGDSIEIKELRLGLGYFDATALSEAKETFENDIHLLF